MYLKTLYLRCFRNYTLLDASFSPGLNVIYGDNAQGKTNLLEAIHFLATGRSHRTPRDHDLIHSNTPETQARALVLRRTGDIAIELLLARQGRKQLKLNGLPERRIVRLVGRLAVVFFSPDDLQLVKGTPSGRRRFLDIEISQISATYLHYLQVYQRVLHQRNALLRQAAGGRLPGTLDLWDEQLLDAAAQLVIRRLLAVQQLAPLVREMHASLSGGSEDLTLTYQSTAFDLTTSPENGAVHRALADALKRAKREEQQRGTTVVGPHRDDLLFSINGHDARTYASQGQQRTAVLALKLAELRYMRQVLGETPVLLLDDVVSELDPARRRSLLASVEDGVQTFLTCTDLRDLAAYPAAVPRTTFRVLNGQLYPDHEGS